MKEKKNLKFLFDIYDSVSKWSHPLLMMGIFEPHKSPVERNESFYI